MATNPTDYKNVAFKRGPQSALNGLTSYIEGTFYLTTDTDRLYFAQTDENLVDLNKSIVIVNSINDLPTVTTDETKAIKGHEVEVGRFYYVKAGASSTSGNILAVCTAINETTHAITWTQVNPDTNTTYRLTSNGDEVLLKDSSDTTRGKFSIASVNSTLTGVDEGIVVKRSPASGDPSSVGFSIKHKNYGTMTSASAAVAINGTSNTFQALKSVTASNGHVTGYELDTYTITFPTPATYDLITSAGASTGAGAYAVLKDSNDNPFKIYFKAGSSIAIDETDSTNHREITIKHGAKGSAATLNPTYSGVSASTSSVLSVLTGVSVDSFGHVISLTGKSINFQGITAKSLEVTKLSSAKIVYADDTKSAEFSLANLGFTATINGTATTIHLGDNAGSFYTASEIDSKINALDGMTYKGGIANQTALSALGGSGSTVKKGDTYKITSATTVKGAVSSNYTILKPDGSSATASEDISVKPGDMLIATSSVAEVNGVIPAGSLQWTYIPAADDVEDTQYKIVPKTGNKIYIDDTNSDGGNTAGYTEYKVGASDCLTVSVGGSAKAATVTYSHNTKTVTKTGASVTGHSFSVITGITEDSWGHIASIASATVTVPKEYLAKIAGNTSSVVLGLKSTDGDTEVSSSHRITFKPGTDLTMSVSGDVVTYAHKSYSTTVTPATSAAISNGGSIPFVKSVTVGSNGHVTAVTFDEKKLPTYALAKSFSVTESNTGVVSSANAHTAAISATISLKDSNNDFTISSVSMAYTLKSETLTINESPEDTIQIDLIWGTF